MSVSYVLLLLLSFVSANEKRLLKRLLNDYEPQARPVLNSSTVVYVELSVGLVKVTNLDLKHEILTTNVLLIQEWRDEFLQWNPSDYHGLETVEIANDKIWVPDVTLENDLRDWEDQPPKPKDIVRYTGWVRWAPPMQLRSLCNIDVSFYPFDTQRCYLRFELWTYFTHKVVLTSSGQRLFLVKEFIESAFQITNTSLDKSINHRQQWAYNVVSYGMELRRRVLYHVYTVIIPCCMISVLTVMVFRLSPESGEKIELGVTVMLVFHLLLWSVGEQMPENSQTVPLIAIYLTAVMTMTSVSVIMSICVLNVHTCGACTEIPNWVRIFVMDKLRRLMRLKISNFTSKRKARRFKSRQAITALAKNLGFARMVEPDFMAPAEMSSEDKRLHGEILKTLQLINGREELASEDAVLAHEWRCVAQILDRLLFWIYLLATIFISLLLLVALPQGHRYLYHPL